MTERLPATEDVDGRTAGIDRVDTVTRVRMLIEAQRGAIDAAFGAADAIARAVDAVVAALRGGGRVIALGAGTSGRLAVLDASELPPTFGFPRERYEGRIAGGDGALRRSIEGAEDDAVAGAASVADAVPGDVVIGVSASGSAAFVQGALAAARANGAVTIALVNAPGSALESDADITIVAETAAEPIAGSTRMRAGTAQKIVLNTISTAAMIALGDNAPEFEEEYEALGSSAGYYDDWQDGRDPAGISTQDPQLAARLDPVLGGRRLANYLRTMTLELQTLARACGKSHVHNLEPEDLVALTVEAAAMAGVPLAGTNWIPGRKGEGM